MLCLIKYTVFDAEEEFSNAVRSTFLLVFHET